MTFKLYEDKSSVLKKNTRYVQGGFSLVYPKHIGWWEKRFIATGQVDDVPFPVTSEFARRPDKIAWAAYARTDLTWLILQYNNIVDINTQLNAGTIIQIPSPIRVFTSICTEPVRYQPR
jgi:hypothetical protein